VPVLRLKDVPQETKAIAEQLFGAQEVQSSKLSAQRVGLQEFYERKASESGAPRAGKSSPAPARHSSSLRPPPEGAAAVVDGVVDGKDGGGESAEKGEREERAKEPEPAREERESKAVKGAGKRSRNQFGLLIGIGMVLAI